MMNIKQLIEKLEAIEDKSLLVFIADDKNGAQVLDDIKIQPEYDWILFTD